MTAYVSIMETVDRFFAQSKYASFQRQLNLYGFTRASIPSIQGNKTKNVSYYSHPYFVRGDISRLHHMIRCKIKGTGKKRCHDDNDDHEYNHDSSSVAQKKNSTPAAYEDTTDNVERGVYPRHKDAKSGAEIDSATLGSKDALSDLEDGDLLFFDGIPFHFLSHLDVASLKDTSGQAPNLDIDSLPLTSLHPTFPPLESNVNSQQTEDVLETCLSASQLHPTAVPRRFPRSIILDDKFESYRNALELQQNLSFNVGTDLPKPNDSEILGVFDHHFYDIHASGTTSRKRKKSTLTASNTNVKLMNLWSYSPHQQTTHVTAK